MAIINPCSYFCFNWERRESSIATTLLLRHVTCSQLHALSPDTIYASTEMSQKRQAIVMLLFVSIHCKLSFCFHVSYVCVQYLPTYQSAWILRLFVLPSLILICQCTLPVHHHQHRYHHRHHHRQLPFEPFAAQPFSCPLQSSLLPAHRRHHHHHRHLSHCLVQH